MWFQQSLCWNLQGFLVRLDSLDFLSDCCAVELGAACVAEFGVFCDDSLDFADEVCGLGNMYPFQGFSFLALGQ